MLRRALFALTFTAVACSDDPPTVRPDATASDDAGPRPDGGRPDGGPGPDAGPNDMVCPNAAIPAPTEGSCNYVAGTGSALLVRGNLVGPGGLLENAHLLIGADGLIACASCDCSSDPAFATASRLECKDGLVSPGLINAHDHITFNEGPPAGSRTERYEHRHDWRTGRNMHTRIPSPRNSGGELGVRWAEVRNLMAGGTSINGSGSAVGLVRNLDRSNGLEGLAQPAVKYETFPLDDNRGTTRAMGCDYGMGRDQASDIANADSYTPHISEGIDIEALNEFACLSGGVMGASEVVTGKTALIHGVALRPVDFQQMASVGASLIWSPRSNIDLYGHTAQVTVARRLGVRIALGTDWVATGSMNMLRELYCADTYNQRYLGRAFTDRELIDMATIHAAEALASDDLIGSLRPGRYADVAIYDGRVNRGYRALLDADPNHVVLVMRGGEPLYGDDALISALLDGGDGCEALDVCGRSKSLCVQRDTGTDLAALRAAIRSDAYDLFFCADPPSEPSCLPTRPGEFSGMSSAGDPDGDGREGADDACPMVFDPPREHDGDRAPNADGDDLGDACDPCPLNADTETCSAPNPNDRDGDGVDNAADNCPVDPNPDQADQDRDMTGDVCDSCPTAANPGGGACPGNIYKVKQGLLTGSVRLPGVLVTAVGPTGYFVQTVMGDAEYDAALGAQYSGLFVYTGPMGMKPTVGDRIDLSGAVGEFFGQTQLSNATFTVMSGGGALPAPVLVDAAEVGAYGTGMQPAAGTERPPMPYEGVLVEVRGVTVTSNEAAPGPGDRAPTNELEVDGGLRIGDYLFAITPKPPVGSRIATISGVLRYANEWAKLEPRSVLDVSGSAELVSIDPLAGFATVGSTTSYTVLLSRTATMATRVALTASSGDVEIPSELIIASGADRGTFDAFARRAASGAPTTIRASLRSVTVSATLHVYDDASPRQIVTLELDATALPVGGMTSGRFEIDLPAPSGGLAVQLTVTPSALGATMPRTATIAAGMTGAAFVLITSTSTGSGTVTASAAGAHRSVSFAVSQSVTRPLQGAGDLIITEIHANPSGNNENAREWFEIHNPTADTITLDGLVISDNVASAAFRLPAGRTIAAGGYLVFAPSDNPANNGGLMGAIAYGTGILLANGGDRITLRVGMTTIDEVAYTSMFPIADGNAICLRAPYADNTLAASWGASVGTYGTTPDRGSPGVESNATNCR